MGENDNDTITRSTQLSSKSDFIPISVLMPTETMQSNKKTIHYALVIKCLQETEMNMSTLLLRNNLHVMKIISQMLIECFKIIFV